MSPISLLDLVFSLSIFVALVFLVTGWERALRKDVKLVLAGLLIIVLFQGVIRFLEWSTLSLEGLGPLSDLIATLEPMLWVFFFYTFFQQVSEQRKEHLNSVLRSIRNINQFLVKTDDGYDLIKKACENLVETRGFSHAWVVLLDSSNKLNAAAQAGLGEHFESMLEDLRAEKFPDCIQKSLRKSGIVTIQDPSFAYDDCPGANNHKGEGFLIKRLEYNGRVYGLLSVSVPGRFIDDEEELSLFEEIAGDIASALHELEVEKDLQKSEKKFRSYVENAPVGVYVVDEDGNYVDVNEAACEMTGYSKYELLDMSIPDLHPPEASEKVQQSFEDLLKTGEMSTELPYLQKDGTEGYFLINAVKISNKRFLGFTLDITEQRKAKWKLEQATLGTLQALNRTIKAKDGYTGEHIDRVQELSVKMGKDLELSEERLEQIRYASILHDIGKIGIPDSILGKPGELTEAEWEEMERHPEIGERIVGQVDQLKNAAKIIGQHQEHYDGSGYPKGLEGEEITLEARIVAVADAWDAMGTDRPYQKALPKEEAIKELEDNAGTQFDPEIVDILLEMVGGDNENFEKDNA